MSRVAWFVVALALAAATAFAQGAKPRSKPGVKTAAPVKAPAPDTHAFMPARSDPETSVALSPSASAMTGRGEVKTFATTKPSSGDAGVSVVERDGGAKQFRFTETDVEGRLKAPQLVYFLRRVRAEFAAGDLGHRSFMRELSETSRDRNF